MSAFIETHGMKTHGRDPEGLGDLANEAFYERLERMIRAGNGGQAPDWLSVDLAIVLYRNVREEEGWHKPATVTIVEELNALPCGAVVRDLENGYVWDKVDRDSENPGREEWWRAGLEGARDAEEISLPALVLYSPAELRRIPDGPLAPDPDRPF